MPALARSSSRYRQPFDPITAVLFKIIQAITYLFVLAVLFMNPIAKQGIINPKAEYIITVAWPDKNPNDIDTYVEDPAGDLTAEHERQRWLDLVAPLRHEPVDVVHPGGRHLDAYLVRSARRRRALLDDERHGVGEGRARHDTHAPTVVPVGAGVTARRVRRSRLVRRCGR